MCRPAGIVGDAPPAVAVVEGVTRAVAAPLHRLPRAVGAVERIARARRSVGGAGPGPNWPSGLSALVGAVPVRVSHRPIVTPANAEALAGMTIPPWEELVFVRSGHR